MDYLINAEKTLAGENVRIRAIGSRKELSEEMQRQIKKTEELTKDRSGIVMNIALNYGGREELLHSAKMLCEAVKNGEKSPEEITEKDVYKRQGTASVLSARSIAASLPRNNV